MWILVSGRSPISTFSKCSKSSICLQQWKIIVAVLSLDYPAPVLQPQSLMSVSCDSDLADWKAFSKMFHCQRRNVWPMTKYQDETGWKSLSMLNIKSIRFVTDRETLAMRMQPSKIQKKSDLIFHILCSCTSNSLPSSWFSQLNPNWLESCGL